MPFRTTLWVEESEIVIDGDGVRVILTSGDRKLTYRTTRARFRDFVERGRRKLDAADIAQELRMVEYRKREADGDH